MSKSPSLRRIQADIRELQMDPSDQYHAAPLENDMFVWHFTIRGAKDTDFENGIYHGKILLPAEYPFKPPNIMFSTPNGRFETNTKLCLSFSAYHPELWQPAWGVRLILEALISFLPTKGDGAIGALDWTSEERKRLARSSGEFCCANCGNCKVLMDRWSERARKCSKSTSGDEKSKTRFQKEIEKLHVLQAATEGPKVKKEVENGEEIKNNITKEEKSNDESRDDIVNITSDTSTKNADKHAEKGEQHTNKVVSDNTQESNTDPTQNYSIISNDKQVEPENVITDTISEVKSDNVNAVVNENETLEQFDRVESSQESSMSQQETVQVAESPLLSDPVVHSCLVVFSAIVFLLIRKLNDILTDMRELEARFQST